MCAVRCLIISMLIMLTANTVAARDGGRYSTSRLQHIAHELNMPDTLHRLPSGIHTDYWRYKGKPVTVITRNYQVEHIGYTIFSQAQRELIPYPIFNFLERYALEGDLPRKGKVDWARQMKRDHVVFDVGSLSQLPALANDSTLSVLVSNHSERAYTVEWANDSAVVCKVTFPSSYELMRGIGMIENENKLRSSIECHEDTLGCDTVKVESLDLYECEDGEYYVLERGINRIPEMPDNLYFTLSTDTVTGDEGLSLLCSTQFPEESVANLFSSLGIDNDYEVDVVHKKYNFKKEEFRVPLRQFIGFLLSEGCRPYYGVIDCNESTHELEAFMEMRNHEEAYEHLLMIKMDTSTLDDRKGLINVSLKSYVPTHNLENLYYDE